MDLQASFNEESSSSYINVIKELLDAAVDVKAMDSKGNTRMHLAMASNKLELLKFLIKEVEADIEVTNAEGETALNVAVDKLGVECVKILVENNCDVNHRMKNKDTPLVYLIKLKTDENSVLESRKKDIINLLITSKTIDFHEKIDGRTALHIAAENGNIFAVKAIINTDPNLNTTIDKDGNCAIHLASLNGHKSIIEVLVDKENIDVNMKGKQSMTALKFAIVWDRDMSKIELWKKRFKVIEYLVELNADCNSSDRSGNSELNYTFNGFYNCCHRNQSPCRLDSCVEECKEINDIKGDQSKILEKNCVFLALAEYLLRNGNADVWKQNNTFLQNYNFDTSILEYFYELSKYLYFSKQKDQLIYKLERSLTMTQIRLDDLETKMASVEMLPQSQPPQICGICKKMNAKDTTVCQLKLCLKCLKNHKACMDRSN